MPHPLTTVLAVLAIALAAGSSTSAISITTSTNSSTTTTSTSSPTPTTTPPPAAIALRVESMLPPPWPAPVLHVGVARPRFSWALQHPERGARQTAFRVLVATAGATGPPNSTVWDSGVVSSNSSIGVRCAVALASATGYQLTVWWADQHGTMSPPASVRFATALLDGEADWAGAAWLVLNASDTRAQFRSAPLALPAGAAPVQRASCHIAGLGFYRAWLDGQRLGGPDVTLGTNTQFQRRVAYDSYDVTEQLQQRPAGGSILSVLLGRGFFALPEDDFTKVLGYKTIGQRALRALCLVALADGRTLRFASGGAGAAWPWRHAAGELVFDHLFLGETRDKRSATPGWQQPDYDDSAWAAATAGDPAASSAPPVPPPPGGLSCPAGQRVDYVTSTGDNGSCDCESYCASDWTGLLQRERPLWRGAAAAYNYTGPDGSLVCMCVQGTHYCPKTAGCSQTCTAAGKPTAQDYCVAESTWTMTANALPPVRRHEPRAPAAIHTSPSGSYVLDFGVNQAMQCELRIESDGTQAGTTLRLHHAEQVDEDGSIIISNDLGNVEDQTTFILDSTAGLQTFETQFAYFGGRFVDVAGWPADSAPSPDSMVCWFVHTALDPWSSIRFVSAANDTADTAAILNGLHDITLRSALSNFMSHPTDCPSREKRGWTGDGQAAAETLIYSFDMSAAYPKWLGDIADAQQCNWAGNRSACAADDPWCRVAGDGSTIAEIAPFLFGGALDACSGMGDPAWSSGFVAVLDWVHRYYADTQVLQQHYAGAAAYLEHLAQYVNNSTQLLDLAYPGNRYGDWCAPLGGARHTSNIITGFYWLKQVRIMAEAAATLGLADDAKKWAAYAEAGAASFERLYFDADAGMFRDIECASAEAAAPAAAAGGSPCHRNSVDGLLSNQTAQALPLYLGLPADASSRQRAGDALARDVLTGTFPGRTTTGLVGTKFVLSELVAAGHADVAMTVATAMDYPSWGRMLPPSVHPLGQGEGTLWEQFRGSLHQGFGSRNHIMLGGFDGPFFYGNLAGIQNAGQAWDRIVVAPTVAGNLSGVEASVGTLRGPVKVAWAAGGQRCGLGHEQDDVCTAPAVIDCTGQGRIAQIVYASYGSQNGSCGNWTATCSAPDSLAVVSAQCLGKVRCAVNATNAVFGGGDPCPGVPKTLAVQALCSGHFALNTSVPVGSSAAVRLPLLGGRSANQTSVVESGAVVWANGTFQPGLAPGVVAAKADQTPAGSVIEILVQAGSYMFSVM